MELQFTTRGSDSPWIDSVWTCVADEVAEMTSVATVHWGLVFWEHEGRRHAAITGPETASALAPVPSGARFVGVEFALGTSPHGLSAAALVDSGVALPDTTGRGFRLADSRWETPTFDNAEALVSALARTGAVERDPVVAAVAAGRRPNCSDRTVERRFRAATGLTPKAVHQIARARRAATLLAAGAATAEVTMRLGYCDEPHLARALRRFVGHSARRLREGVDGAIALDLAAASTPPTGFPAPSA